jgi:hypothetical protein
MFLEFIFYLLTCLPIQLPTYLYTYFSIYAFTFLPTTMFIYIYIFHIVLTNYLFIFPPPQKSYLSIY